ncbi:MAG TPA: PEP/pyruvate-binding domain-containing protein [Syntrophorhabdales bacterium]|nr:PEP/pyruvate-binding domain-containing protein [Syntrophorhabdales bacterium]
MTDKEKRMAIWYEELDGNDYPLVGKKNANLGEMIKAGIPVAPGFAITILANDRFITETGIKEKLAAKLPELGEVTYETAKEAGDFAVDLIENTALPPDLEAELLSNYRELCSRYPGSACPVAVRSSGSVSMPGQMETYLNILGEKDFIDYVRRCWASAYNAEAIMYRMNKGMHFLFNIGVGVPRMVRSRVSGIIFTINPVNGDPSKISIDASCGLGEAVVSGIVTPDTHLIDKVTMELIKTTVGSKEIECVYREEGSDIVQVPVSEDRRCVACLNREEILELARLGKLIEDYYGKAYDIEFGIDADMPFPENIIILQVRAESVWSKKEVAARTEKKKDPMERIVGQLLAGMKLR